MIEDTSKRDPLLHMAGMLGGDYITGLEAQGQHQIVRSDLLPSDGPWADLESLGFKAGPVKADDPLFREATLPAGWSREGSDHNMWSYVVDARGLRRVSVFYKAAPYDRHAHCGIVDVGHVAARDVIYGDGPVELPGAWAVFDDAERASLEAGCREHLAQCDECPSVYGERRPRADALLMLAGRARAGSG
jgi:hypothetical protein